MDADIKILQIPHFLIDDVIHQNICSIIG